MSLSLRLLDDPILHQPTQIVLNFDRQLRRLARDMVAFMYENSGAGLAAPQIGEPWRLAVIDCEAPRYRTFTDPHLDIAYSAVLVNPVIKSRAGSELAAEGCLSIPGIRVAVERATDITLEYQTMRGERIKAAPWGFLARVIQHEVDHLDGITMLDRLAPEAREAATNQYYNFIKAK